MKKSAICLLLMGVFFLVSRLTFAEDVKPSKEDDLQAVKQAENSNLDATAMPSDAWGNSNSTDTQANSDAAQMPDIQGNSDEVYVPVNSQTNPDNSVLESGK